MGPFIALAVIIVVTYVAGFSFITEKPIVLAFLLVLVGCYMSIGLAVGLIQRKSIIEEAKAAKSK